MCNTDQLSELIELWNSLTSEQKEALLRLIGHIVQNMNESQDVNAMSADTCLSDRQRQADTPTE